MEHGKAAFCTAAKAHGVGIVKYGCDDPLACLQAFNGTDAVAKLGGAFEAQVFGSLFHLLAQRLGQFFAFALQDQDRLVHSCPVINGV